MRQKAEKYADVHRAVSCADKPWSERKQSTPGYMTVYLALVMGILLSLILAVLTAVRISTIRMYIECCADMALDSALAEYHREMLDQYDLFFIDTAYQTGDPSYHRTEEHIFRYMERNLQSTGGISNSRGKRPAGAFDRRCGAFAGRCCN